MLSIFKSTISVEQAVIAYSQTTIDIRNNYLQQVFPNTILENVDIVKENLFFLAMYVIDGLIKNPKDKSWFVHRETLLKRYYNKCTAFYNEKNETGTTEEELNTFISSYASIMLFYNSALSEHTSQIRSIRNRDDRISFVARFIGESFALLCGDPEDKQYRLIGTGAVIVVHQITNPLFLKSKISQ